MKPYRAPVLEFLSKNKNHSLSIPMPPKKATLKWDEKKYMWPEIPNSHPEKVLFNEPRMQIILIGGLGNPGSNLGDIYIHELSGALVCHIRLSKQIPHLESLSRQWRDSTNFPWVAAVKQEPSGDQLNLWVCEQIKVTIDLKTFLVSTAPSTDPQEWVGSN